jgi:hypothetical protein
LPYSIVLFFYLPASRTYTHSDRKRRQRKGHDTHHNDGPSSNAPTVLSQQDPYYL